MKDLLESYLKSPFRQLGLLPHRPRNAKPPLPKPISPFEGVVADERPPADHRVNAFWSFCLNYDLFDLGIPLIFLFEGFIGQAFEWEGFSTGVDQEVSADYLYALSIIVHQYIKKITVQTHSPVAPDCIASGGQ
ncbi:MAG: hypothetical protein IPN74_12820 [Haliscomenobacter sp.]|nr:hypothetical protein [Haliscomenobacter sp.]